MNRQTVKLPDIILSVLVIAGLTLALFFQPETTIANIELARQAVMTLFTPMFLWVSLGIVLLCIFVSFSKYGGVTLGGDKPEHSTFQWVIMIFCTGMGSTILYWSGIEWMNFYASPPHTAQPYTAAAAELASSYTIFHWGITGWAIYAVGAVTLGLRYYTYKKPGLTLSCCCDRAVPGGVCGKPAERVIEVLYLFSTIAGYASIVAFVVPMYCNNLAYLFGIPNNFATQMVLIGCVTVLFTLSACFGLNRGIRRLSSINIGLALCMVGFFLFAGPTEGIINLATQSLGYVTTHFFQMSLWTDAIGGSVFTRDWTGFYWAWWIGLAPSMWVFIAKISRGRTVRQVLLGTMLSGAAGCFLYFAIIGNYGVLVQLSGAVDLVGIMETQGPEMAITQMIMTLPLGKLMLGFWTLTGLVFLITTMDSGAYTLAASTSQGLESNQHPSVKLRMFWAVLIVAIPVGMLYAKSPVATIQATIVLTAVPITLFLMLTLISGYHYLTDRPDPAEPISKKPPHLTQPERVKSHLCTLVPVEK